MVYKLDKDLEQYFKDMKKTTKFSRLFRLPRIGYRCYIKRQGQKDKIYIQFVGCEDDTLVYETQKCLYSFSKLFFFNVSSIVNNYNFCCSKHNGL